LEPRREAELVGQRVQAVLGQGHLRGGWPPGRPTKGGWPPTREGKLFENQESF
jgi:hypothetical protein